MKIKVYIIFLNKQLPYSINPSLFCEKSDAVLFLGKLRKLKAVLRGVQLLSLAVSLTQRHMSSLCPTFSTFIVSLFIKIFP